MTLRPERVLLLGAGGPLGQTLARGLARGGAEVTATGRHLNPDALDVSDWRKVSDFIQGLAPTTVIYLVNGSVDTDFRTEAGKAIGNLKNALIAASGASVRRFLFTSSAAIYGDQGELPFHEQDPKLGTSNYALLKSALEEIVEEHSRTTHMATASLRIFNVYGSGFNTSLINKLMDPETTPDLAVSESYVRDYVHSEDVVSAIASFIKSDIAGHSVFNIGTGHATSNALLAQLFADRSFRPATFDGRSRSVADAENAKRTFGFLAKMSIEEFMNI